MTPTAPSPTTWTLRFKNHKSTTLLHVDPLQSFDSIKAELLRALHQTHPNGRLPDGLRIPSKASDVVIGKPTDTHTLSGGWMRLPNELHTEEDDGEQRSKKKARSSFRENCPTAAGLKEGAVLAYKFRADDEVEDEDEGLGLDEEQEKWDVVIASYEDGAEVGQEGDGGPS